VPLPELRFVPLKGDLPELVRKLPAAPGVGQLRGPDHHNLLLAPASNLRRWAADHLGLGEPPPPGRRPRTNLRGVATSIGWARTTSPFAQRLLYERLVAPLVPLSERRDLKPPAFLHLDPSERFPRVTVRGPAEEGAGSYGPFRHRRAAEKARDRVNRLFGLRPCELVFEPAPDLPLGLGCLYAQVRSCAAPCLSRIGEADYRALAARAARWLSDPASRSDDPDVIAPAVEEVATSRGVVVGAGRREIELYPVCAGRVLEDAAATSTPDELDAAVSRLRWPPPSPGDDWSWLLAWIATPRGRGSYIPVRAAETSPGGLTEMIRVALPRRFARPAAGGNVGSSRGEA
jgi:excinuclease ABC subunit C